MGRREGELGGYSNCMGSSQPHLHEKCSNGTFGLHDFCEWRVWPLLIVGVVALDCGHGHLIAGVVFASDVS